MPSPERPAYPRCVNSDTLADRLVRVRRRVESDVPYSPDWAAATEELEAALAAERAATVTSDPLPLTLIETTAA